MSKLNQIVAVEKGVKSKTYGYLTEVNKLVQKSALFNGFAKNYEKKDEASEDLPPEKLRVTNTVDALLKSIEGSLSELISITARKDYTNCVAKADVKIGETILIKDAPVSFLLFLEKTFTDLRTCVSNLPTLDDAESWTFDKEAMLYKTEPVKTHRTKKVNKPIVLYPATPEHPAQTQMATEDVIAGYWNLVKMSGAWPKSKKENLMAKIDTFLKAVKEAREEANMFEEVSVPNDIAKVFDYLMVQ